MALLGLLSYDGRRAERTVLTGELNHPGTGHLQHNTREILPQQTLKRRLKPLLLHRRLWTVKPAKNGNPLVPLAPSASCPCELLGRENRHVAHHQASVFVQMVAN